MALSIEFDAWKNESMTKPGCFSLLSWLTNNIIQILKMGIIEINHQSHLTEKIIALLDLHYATSGIKNNFIMPLTSSL